MAIKKIPKCPKCNGAIDQYDELTVGAINWHVSKKGLLDEDGVYCEPDIEGVVAICGECKHKWRLRGVVTIAVIKELYGN